MMRFLLQFDALSISTSNVNGTTVASTNGRGATGQISNATSGSTEQDLVNGINNLTIQPTAAGPMRLRRQRVRVNPVSARRKQRTTMQQGIVHLYYQR